MSRNYLYKYGLPFSEKLGVNINALKTRIDQNKASLLLIDGGVGEGKTTLGVEVVDYYNSLHGLPKLDLGFKAHPQLAMGGDQFIKQLRVCYEKDLPAIFYDEAGDFSKRGSLTRFNALLNRTFETYRGFRILVIIALPNFSILDNNIFYLNIPRGLLHLRDRSENSGTFFGYSLVLMNWIRYWHEKLPKGIKYKCYKKVIPNFKGHFLDLEPERSKQLDAISTSGKLALLGKAEIKLEGLMTYKDLSDKLNRSVVWIRLATQKLKLKEKKIIKKAKYFDENTLNRLLDFLDEGGLVRK